MTDYVTIDRLTSEDEGIAVVRLDRPPLNALSTAVQDQLTAAAAEVSGDGAVRAVVITGGPRVFAAGADITEFADNTYLEHLASADRVSRVCSAIAAIPRPVVAAVNGYAIGGGCELGLAADLRVCGQSSRWGLPEIRLGLLPGAGGTQRLPRLIGPARAKRMIYSGRPVDAAEAYRIGLVDEVVPDAAVLAAAVSLAREFTAWPPMALRQAKAAVDDGADLDLTSALRLETRLIHPLFPTGDTRTAIRHFVEKGPRAAPPRYNGS